MRNAREQLLEHLVKVAKRVECGKCGALLTREENVKLGLCRKCAGVGKFFRLGRTNHTRRTFQ